MSWLLYRGLPSRGINQFTNLRGDLIFVDIISNKNEFVVRVRNLHVLKLVCPSFIRYLPKNFRNVCYTHKLPSTPLSAVCYRDLHFYVLCTELLICNYRSDYIGIIKNPDDVQVTLVVSYFVYVGGLQTTLMRNAVDLLMVQR